MADQKPPERADFVQRGESEKLLPLTGEFITRMRRMVAAFMGYDVTQVPEAQGAKFDRRLALQAIVANLDAAPFRLYGQSFSTRLRAAAPGAGNFGVAAIENISKDDGDLVVIDWFTVTGGATDWEYGRSAGGALTPLGCYAIEQRGGKRSPTFGTGGVVNVPSVAQLSSFIGSRAAVLVDGIDADIFGSGANLAGDMKRITLGDAVVFAGEAFWLQQLTANLALNVTFHGRFFRLGKEIT